MLRLNLGSYSIKLLLLMILVSPLSLWAGAKKLNDSLACRDSLSLIGTPRPEMGSTEGLVRPGPPGIVELSESHNRDFNGIEETIPNWEGSTIVRSVSEDGQVSYVVQWAQNARPLRMDPTGNTVIANDQVGRSLGEYVLSAGGMSLMMIDVNFLGQINYFENGTQDGDAYLASVSNVIVDIVGDQGIPMRWGGDEFVIAIKTKNTEFLKDLQQQIIDGVSDDPAANSIFNREMDLLRKQHRLVQESQSFEDLPVQFIEKLDPGELSFAQSDFAHFLKIHQMINGKALYEAEAYKPSVSIGSAVVGEGNVQTGLSMAESIAERSKVILKITLGMSVKKYTGRDRFLPPQEQESQVRDLKARTLSMEPAIVPVEPRRTDF